MGSESINERDLARWPTRRLGDLAKVKGGKRMPSGTSLVSSKTEHPYLRIVDFARGTIDSSHLLYVPNDVFPKIRRYTISSNDVYISIVGTIGIVGMVPESLNGANLTENAAKICEVSEELLPKFLATYLQSPIGQDQIAAMTVGSTQPKLALFRIADIAIPCPTLEEQTAIAEIVDVIDSRVSLLFNQSHGLEMTARAIFKSWFVDFDPVRAKAEGREPEGMDTATAALFPSEFDQSDSGSTPRGWNQGILGEVCEAARSVVQKSNMLAEENYVGLEHIPCESWSLHFWGTAEGLQSGKSRFKRGDILFGKLRPYFHKVCIAPVDGICSTDILVLRANPPWVPFVLCHASSKVLIEYATRLSNGAKMPRSRWQDLHSYKVAVPPEGLAAVFANIVQPMIDQIIANVHVSITLTEIRDSLLPRLISGKLRIPEAEKMVEAVL